MKGTADEVDVTIKPSFFEEKNGLTLTQAVVILRSYIAIELRVLHLKSYEIQSNQCAQAILRLIAFLGID